MPFQPSAYSDQETMMVSPATIAAARKAASSAPGSPTLQTTTFQASGESDTNGSAGTNSAGGRVLLSPEQLAQGLSTWSTSAADTGPGEYDTDDTSGDNGNGNGNGKEGWNMWIVIPAGLGIALTTFFLYDARRRKKS